MSPLEYLLPFVVALTILVFIHELGHYVPARRAGVKVEVFSIGFGPELFGFTDKHGTRWRVSLIPLGGYVRMYGDANAASAPDQEKLSSASEEERSLSMHSKTVGQRIAISFGGPFANFLFAIVAMFFLFTFKGEPILPSSILEVKAGSVAEEIGLKAGDQIVSFNKSSVSDFKGLKEQILNFEGQKLEVDVKREGETKPLSLSLEKKEGFKKPFQLGVVPGAPIFEKKGIGEAAAASFMMTYQMSKDILVSLGQTISGQKKAGDLGGILAIGDMAGKSAQSSFASFVWFLILLSINLGLLNLFPLPMLDGGAIVFSAIEGIIGRPVPLKIQEYLYMMGFAVVVSLMVYVTWNDLMRYGFISKILGFFS